MPDIVGSGQGGGIDRETGKVVNMERISELGSVVDVYVLVVMTGPGGAAIWAFATRHRDQPQC